MTTSYQEDEALPAHLLLIYHPSTYLSTCFDVLRVLCCHSVSFFVEPYIIATRHTKFCSKRVVVKTMRQDNTTTSVWLCCCCRSLNVVVRRCCCGRWNWRSVQNDRLRPRPESVSQVCWGRGGRRGWVELWKLSWTWNCWTPPAADSGVCGRAMWEVGGHRCALRCRLFCWHNEI